MQAYRRQLLLIIFAVLLCSLPTACQTVDAEMPEEPEPTEPPELTDMFPPVPAEAAVVLTPYAPAKPGTKDLAYNDDLEFYMQEYETEQSDGGFSAGASLMCRELGTGNEWALDDLGYGSDHSYWSSVKLYTFTGILGYDGFIFEHPAGVGYEAYDFYKVSDDGAIRIATCYNTIYTADLDGDGQLELLSNYHNMGYLDLFYRDEDHGSAHSCSLNETARDFFDLRPGRDWVGLRVQEETGAITASWEMDDGSSQSEAVDIATLWEWEKNRTEFWDAVTLHTADGRAPLVLLREMRDASPWSDCNQYQVEEIQVYEDGALLQTISAADLSYDGGHAYNYYQFDSSNHPVLVKQEVCTYQDAPQDWIWHTTYELVDGEMVQTGHELREISY